MQIGSVVYLLSGGPAMTITESPQTGSWGVHWMAGSTLQAATFPEAALTDTDPTPAIQVQFATAVAALQPAQQTLQQANSAPAQSGT